MSNIKQVAVDFTADLHDCSLTSFRFGWDNCSWNMQQTYMLQEPFKNETMTPLGTYF